MNVFRRCIFIIAGISSFGCAISALVTHRPLSWDTAFILLTLLGIFQMRESFKR